MHAIWGPFAPDLVESGEREMEQLWEGLSTAVLGVCLGLLQMFGYSLEVKVKALSKGPRYIYIYIFTYIHMYICTNAPICLHVHMHIHTF